MREWRAEVSKPELLKKRIKCSVATMNMLRRRLNFLERRTTKLQKSI